MIAANDAPGLAIVSTPKITLAIPRAIHIPQVLLSAFMVVASFTGSSRSIARAERGFVPRSARAGGRFRRGGAGRAPHAHDVRVDRDRCRPVVHVGQYCHLELTCQA